MTNWHNAKNISNSNINIGGSISNSTLITGSNGRVGGEGVEMDVLSHKIACQMQLINSSYFSGGDREPFNRFIITLDRAIHFAGHDVGLDTVYEALAATRKLLNEMVSSQRFGEIEQPALERAMEGFTKSFEPLNPVLKGDNETIAAQFRMYIENWFRNFERELHPL
jgi:hypothetical protein